MSISEKRKLKIFNKFDGRCAYCGIDLNYKTFHIDHAIPKTRGGSNNDNNLFPSCALCNMMKYNNTVSEFKKYIIEELPILVSNIPKIKLFFRLLEIEIPIIDGFEFYFETRRKWK